MNVFHKVTLQSLKKNRVRTLVTIVGIILSTALMCAVTTSASSLINYMRNYCIMTQGKWQGAVKYLDGETADWVVNSDKVNECLKTQEVGYAEIDSKNEYKPYLFIESFSKNPDGMVAVNIIDGHFPESRDEILIPDHLNYNGSVKYKIGDEIELEVGDRISDEGFRRTQNQRLFTTSWEGYKEITEINSDEKLVIREKKKYTVCGFYERSDFEEYDAPGYTAITLNDDVPEDAYCSVYFTMKNPKNIYEFISQVAVSSQTDCYVTSNHHDLLMLMGVSKYETFYNMFNGLITVLIVIIMFGSVALIYNSFSISVSERTKQFGLLSSIGATKRQMRHMVIYEALVLGVIGIPLGILVGIAGISVTLNVLGSKIAKFIGYEVPMKIYVSPAVVAVACGISLITILISAFIPSIRATRATAVEAIRQNKDIKKKDGKPEGKLTRFKNGIVFKLFGISGLLAGKYFKRSKKKYRSTIMSLFASVVLFISASSFCNYTIKSISNAWDSNGMDLFYFASDEDLEVLSKNDLYDIFSSDENVTDVAYYETAYIDALIDKNYISEKLLSESNQVASDGIYDYPVQLVFLDDNSYRELLRENGLDEDEYMNVKNPVGVAIDTCMQFNPVTQRMEEISILKGDECEYTGEYMKDIDGYYYSDVTEKNGATEYIFISLTDSNDTKVLTESEARGKVKFRSGKTIHTNPYWNRYKNNLIVCYPYSASDNFLPDYKFHYSTSYAMLSENHARSAENISQKLRSAYHRPDYHLTDYAEEEENERNLVMIVKVFSYGFIVLISLIASANVFNTVTTNIGLRKRDFAMLKSMGMSNRDFNSMINYECIIYGSKALIAGLPVSAIISYVICRVLNEGMDTEFMMPWKAVGIAVLSIFTVVFATMMYSMSKIKGDNTVETLKNENI